MSAPPAPAWLTAWRIQDSRWGKDDRQTGISVPIHYKDEIQKFFPEFKDEGEVVAGFGSAKLIRFLDGKTELRGGSNEDRAAAREWISMFWSETVVHKRIRSVQWLLNGVEAIPLDVASAPGHQGRGHER